MLKKLTVKNYALIRELDVEFHSGFSIITGETGAGKSILLGALSLIIGQRADTSVLKDKDKKCVVEGLFNVAEYGLEELFKEQELDYDNETVIRREIGVSGKSRAFINDTPVSLKIMREVGLRLIDIHSQHKNLELSNHIFQLMVVDACAGNSEILVRYRQVFETYHNLIKELKILEENKGKVNADLEFWNFQFEQLESAALEPDEQNLLEKELEVLNNSEEIKLGLTNISNLLNSEDNPLTGVVKESVSIISKIERFIPGGESLHKRLESVYLELKDTAEEAERSAENIEYNPERLTAVNERLDLIYSLQQKHRLATVDELIALKDELNNKILAVTFNDEKIEQIRGKITEQEVVVLELARQLSDNRETIIPKVEANVNNMLLQLGMPNSQFKVQFTNGQLPNSSGVNSVNFLFSANKSSELNDISKVASGGELSRLMLSIKSLISESKALPTIIFDEIDSGISGEIAGKMGAILTEMSKGMQVINITHLPQIAARGDHHFRVYKKDIENETITNLKLLSKQERVDELAKMLSGEDVTSAAIQNAEELLGVKD
jgi:DNA repair protein RecN (Recombination protein N)